jgi:PAS domain S-box-containing protein
MAGEKLMSAVASQPTIVLGSEQSFRLLVDSVKDYAITMLDLDGQVVSWNPGAAFIQGYAPEEVLGQHFSRFYPQEDIQRGIPMAELDAAGRDGRYENMGWRVRKDGSRFWAGIAISALRDQGGKLIGFAKIIRDLTEVKQVEERMKAASLYARSLIEASLDPLVTISPEGTITDVNKATEQVTGLARDKLIGSDFSDYFTEPSKARSGYQEVLSKGFVRDYPLAIRHASGQVTDVLYNATVYRDEANNVKGVFAAARDITETKKAQESIRLASLYARSLIEASLDPLVTISPDGTITDVNKATEQATGLARDKLIGSDFCNYFTEPERARSGYKTVLARGFVRDYPLAIRHASGQVTDVLYNATVYRDEADNVAGVFAAARDITETRKAEERIQQQSREILELSTPVMQVWEGVVAAPLIGSLDSARTQQFMERLLERIVETNSPVALVDIMGVPTIDTQIAMHLLETISAVRLLGAQVVLTGVRPAIAQTLVHLGIDLSNITTRSSLSAGLKVALDILNLRVASKHDNH